MDKKKYFNFLDKKIKNMCINKSYKKIYDLKEVDKIPSKNSNTQILYLINEITKNKNIKYYNNLMLLFTHFISFYVSINLFKVIKKQKLNDEQIIDYILKYSSNKKNIQSSTIDHCKARVFAFNYIKDTYTNHIKLKKNIKYLDVGCGDGFKTNLFAQIFQIKESNIHGCDINTWGPYSNKKMFKFDFTFIENDKLNYDDKSFDLVTCFLTLHHIKNFDVMINEMYRILKKDGILIIIEHDLLNYYDQLIVDIEHMFFGFFYDKDKLYLKNPHYALYFNNMEFEYIFTIMHKFKLICKDTYYESIDMQKKYDQQFFQIYQKN